MLTSLFDLPVETGATPKRDIGGKPRVQRANREQVTMRLAALDDLLPTEHLARIIWAMVEQLDLSAFYATIRAVEGAAGHPAIDPTILLALWLYATADGVGSARELDRLCREHVAYQWLCGGVSVNYHTLADFRVAHERELDAVLTRSVAGLMAEGLVTLERTAQDGIRVRASAGSASFRRRERLEQFQVEAQARVEHLKTQADDARRTPRQTAAQARAARERLARVQQAVAELVDLEQHQANDHKPKAKRKPARVSTTDPQARKMKMPDGGYRPAYNGQLAVDTGSGVIVGVDLDPSGRSRAGGADVGATPGALWAVAAGTFGGWRLCSPSGLGNGRRPRDCLVRALTRPTGQRPGSDSAPPPGRTWGADLA